MRGMDARRCRSSCASTVEPTIGLELAALCRVLSSEQQQTPGSNGGASKQYPAVDFSMYSSFRRGLRSSLPYSSPSLRFRVSGACGSKRLRVDGSGGDAETATLSETPPAELAALADCRPSTSSSLVSEGCLDNFLSRRGVGVAVEAAEQDHPGIEQEELSDVRKENSGGATDPVEVLGVEVVQHVLTFLDWRSVAACLAVSREWNKCAQASFIWDRLCGQMWEGKINLHSSVRDPAISPLRKFQILMADAHRVRIEPGDLCRWVWEYHWKELAGEYWMQFDPYFHGLPLMRRIFHEDGHITAEPMDQLYGGHECSWTMRKRGGARLVRINHWPPMMVTRTTNWGWQMENEWVIYTSTNIAT